MPSGYYRGAVPAGLTGGVGAAAACCVLTGLDLERTVNALGIAMWISRYWLIIPVLAIAGSLARKRPVAVTAGTLPTHTPLFVLMLVGVVLLVGALNFVPALALGPIAEHLQMVAK